MNITELLSENRMRLELEGTTKEEIIDELIALLERSGALKDAASYREAVMAREQESSTGIGFGIAIPHGKTHSVASPAVAFGRKLPGIDWDSIDTEDATLFFMLAVPEDGGSEHLKILQNLSRKLVDDEFRLALEQAPDKAAIAALVAQIQS
ncbi:fructose PTS transporter subunit IIA [Paenibacillus sp. P96]|uniref:Fructose PTS transporter subunit IIA n=1 Tax=Paenibacillus zeirhizosphaerae TaxID=2987519 RepID=A0ABT9FN21_9BACL|nr:PTS sugar transporter subunit IIA [Paenibacillus sp. P96]MDP4096126.1 fructose PTS transporter subunit IIA [Paenibacillus sp. P96]